MTMARVLTDVARLQTHLTELERGLVETRGFEPLTPCVQSRCAAKTPNLQGFLRVRAQNISGYLSGVAPPMWRFSSVAASPVNRDLLLEYRMRVGSLDRMPVIPS